DPTADVRNLQLFVDGHEVPIAIQPGAIGKEDLTGSIGFYGVGLGAASSGTRVYWLAAGSQPGQRIPKLQGKGSPATATSFPYTVERKDRTIYFSSLLNGDAENFFGPVVGGQAVDQSLTLQRVNKGAAVNAQLQVSLQGVTQQQHQVKVSL